MWIWLLVFAFVWLWGPPARGAERGATAESESSSSEALHLRLQNGLEVVLEPNHRAPLVAVLVAYDGGAARDPRGHEGLAHLVEHLTFRGSRHLPALGIFTHLEDAGTVRWNGVTAEDFAAYYAVVPARHFRLCATPFQPNARRPFSRRCAARGRRAGSGSARSGALAVERHVGSSRGAERVAAGGGAGRRAGRGARSRARTARACLFDGANAAPRF
jgi:hypothetical protein